MRPAAIMDLYTDKQTKMPEPHRGLRLFYKEVSKMNRYALAIDLGAGSGRHVLGWRQGRTVVMEEIYRFPNRTLRVEGELCWDIEHLWHHLLEGMKKCREMGKIPSTVAIDGWGVDYVLLDADGRRLGNAVCYRDARTEGFPQRLEQSLPFEAHYARAGIARQAYNTVYQLMADLEAHPEKRRQAKHLLFLPCYLSYLLCGRMRNEYTIASTSGFLHAHNRDWDELVLEKAGIPRAWLGEKPAAPATRLAALRPEVREAVGFDCEVILTAAHDTASAFYAIPDAPKDTLFLSSGTWSLLGARSDRPVLSDQARDAGFSNEGGVGGVNVLRNIMGMWLLQRIHREWGEKIGFAEMARLAKEGAAYTPVFDVTNPRFLNPPSMRDEIISALRQQNERPPRRDAELLFCVNHSLAVSYGKAVKELQKLLERSFSQMVILGGGNQNDLLNRLTEAECRMPVACGPKEGSALGNLNVQLLC